jgi:hypothetical protein
MTQRGAWLALTLMMAACALPEATPVDAAPPPAAPPRAVRPAVAPPVVPPPPPALVRAYDDAAARSVRAAGASSEAGELQRLRFFAREAQAAMAALQRTARGPRYTDRLAAARDAVAALSAYLAKLDRGEPVL